MSIWAITTYFNLSKSNNRRLNFQAFHKALGIPLVVVELVFPGSESELTEHFAAFSGSKDDRHVVIRGGSILWQKERFLNLALLQIPNHIENVAWIDGDILFDNANWSEEACSKLKTKAFVQLFSRVRFQAPGLTSSDDTCMEESSSIMSIRGYSDCYTEQGRAWAGRLNLIRKHGFYDAMIVGSGDLGLFRTITGDPSITWSGELPTPTQLYFNERQEAHYLEWANPFRKDLLDYEGAGYIDQRITHLWHGEKKNRHYVDRHLILHNHSFDPYEDIVVGHSGAWYWATNKTEMHQAVFDYFVERREDDSPIP